MRASSTSATLKTTLCSRHCLTWVRTEDRGGEGARESRRGEETSERKKSRKKDREKRGRKKRERGEGKWKGIGRRWSLIVTNGCLVKWVYMH